MNKEMRKSLIEKYLNVEADVAEERRLARWFAAHGAEADEAEVAAMLLAEYPDAAYEAGEMAFDSLVDGGRRRSLIVRRACAAAACVVLAVGLWMSFPRRNTCDFSALEIAQGIEQIMALNMDDVESITARPVRGDVILTALMKDGTTCSYIMSRDGNTSAVSFVAMNN